MANIRRFFTYSLPIIILLNGYASGIPGLSIGAIVMNLFNIYALLTFAANNGKLDRFCIRTLLLFLLFALLSCFGYFLYGVNSIQSIFKSTLKMLTWFMGVTFTSKLLFDFEIFKPYYRKFCIVCTAYLFLQMISWNTVRVYLPNLFNFGFIRPLYEQYSTEAYISYLSAIGFGRFSSFFAEPAYYGILMVIDLVIIVFDEYYPKGLNGKVKIEVLILIVGVWVSTSTAAILFVLFIIGVYFIKTNLTDKFLLLFIGACALILLTFVFSTNSLTSFFVDKVSTMGTSGRVGGSYAELNNLSPLQWVFGVGMSNEGVITDSSYFNVFTGLIIEYGVVGFSVFLFYMFALYLQEKSVALHVLLIIYLAAMFQGGYLFNLYGILFFCVAQNFRRKDINLANKERLST